MLKFSPILIESLFLILSDFDSTYVMPTANADYLCFDNASHFKMLIFFSKASLLLVIL